MRLTDEEKRMLNGQEGEAKKLAMEILTQVGDSMDADSFVEIASVQAMAHFGSLHIAGRDWLEKLACLGGKCCSVRHPVALNAASRTGKSCHGRSVRAYGCYRYPPDVYGH